jgi:RNA polymerase sigma-70 factor (ECF subfamily)
MSLIMDTPTKIPSDEEIAHLVSLGDKELFGELIDRYEQKLTRYVRRFIQHQDDVSDIIQIVFIKAYTNLKSFDTTRSFNSWIYRIAHNESVTHLKKRGGEKVSFIDFDTFLPHPFAKEETDSEALSREDKEQLEHSLSKISLKYREVLVLYYYDELTYQEIADVLHIPIATVGVRIKRGKESLHSMLLTNHYEV